MPHASEYTGYGRCPVDSVVRSYPEARYASYDGMGRVCPGLSTREDLAATIARLKVEHGVLTAKKGAWLRCDYCMRSGASEFDWRPMVAPIAKALELRGEGVPGGHAYQFGVFTGGTMYQLWGLLRPQKMWGFDSFKGLPPEIAEERVEGWGAGMYSGDPRELLTRRIGVFNINFVAGFYNESLAPARDSALMQLGLAPASYVDVDCDLYSSSIDALDFMFRNQLIVPGTIVGYDDWWILPCGRGGEELSPLEVGEGRAHAEMTRRYDVEFLCVAGPCKRITPKQWSREDEKPVYYPARSSRSAGWNLS